MLEVGEVLDRSVSIAARALYRLGELPPAPDQGGGRHLDGLASSARLARAEAEPGPRPGPPNRRGLAQLYPWVGLAGHGYDSEVNDVMALRSIVERSCGWRCDGRVITGGEYERLPPVERANYEWAADDGALACLIAAELDALFPEDLLGTADRR
jgi:hypothetical protein